MVVCSVVGKNGDTTYLAADPAVSNGVPSVTQPPNPQPLVIDLADTAWSWRWMISSQKWTDWFGSKDAPYMLRRCWWHLHLPRAEACGVRFPRGPDGGCYVKRRLSCAALRFRKLMTLKGRGSARTAGAIPRPGTRWGQQRLSCTLAKLHSGPVRVDKHHVVLCAPGSVEIELRVHRGD
eukprot:TRINITY_DN8716_c0_g1_i4.p2 TRINITY_DN8716_c0_g1~~TRINITY_DN8716_c0_g1_i4.p2  ORF type:complete len:179 (-),score=5.63 TRINITY_DN8716_c0_g1_i4:133-669(-)